MTEYLDPEQALAAVAHLGLRLRDPGLLLSALARPSATAFGEDAYPALEEKAAALLESVARNHALFDGNKRLSWYLALAFLHLNGTRLVMDEDRAFELILGVATGRIEVAGSAAAIRPCLVAR